MSFNGHKKTRETMGKISNLLMSSIQANADRLFSAEDLKGWRSVRVDHKTFQCFVNGVCYEVVVKERL